MKQINQEELGTIIEHFATMEACVTCLDILHRIESMLQAGDNLLAKSASEAIGAVLELYQQAGANVPDSFWEDRA